ncbi:MAG: cbb3-type cytochrome c oxidase subunit 3 [Oligoflexia bacterium]|nr:cbb3-type cytochrome c oxidase subunit 3 [Oligoflexia bacterium]
MIRETLAHYPYGTLSGVGMLLFFAVFLGAVAWVCRRRSGEFYARLSALPFSSEAETAIEKGNEK